MLDCFNVDHVKFDNLIKRVSSRILYLKLTLFQVISAYKINISTKSFVRTINKSIDPFNIPNMNIK